MCDCLQKQLAAACGHYALQQKWHPRLPVLYCFLATSSFLPLLHAHLVEAAMLFRVKSRGIIEVVSPGSCQRTHCGELPLLLPCLATAAVVRSSAACQSSKCMHKKSLLLVFTSLCTNGLLPNTRKVVPLSVAMTLSSLAGDEERSTRLRFCLSACKTGVTVCYHSNCTFVVRAVKKRMQ